jgi:hypothetical protein
MIILFYGCGPDYSCIFIEEITRIATYQKSVQIDNYIQKLLTFKKRTSRFFFQIPSAHKSREVSMELLREASQLGVNLYEEHQRFVKSFDPKWRTDEQVMLLLSAIALFSPDTPNVIHRDVVKLEQVRFSRGYKVSTKS